MSGVFDGCGECHGCLFGGTGLGFRASVGINPGGVFRLYYEHRAELSEN